jgi:hypothetical protein
VLLVLLLVLLAVVHSAALRSYSSCRWRRC